MHIISLRQAEQAEGQAEHLLPLMKYPEAQIEQVSGLAWLHCRHLLMNLHFKHLATTRT